MEMEYNTDLPHLIISEYGRNIQKMVDHACSLEDRDTRNKAAKTIIDVMGQLNPHLRDVPDFKHKLWDHLFIMSEFKLDVDSPYPYPNKEILFAKPEKLSYPSNQIRYKHYGKNIENLIQKAISTENEEHKQEFTNMLANHMKSSYVNWNRDSVGDEIILKQLRELSKAQLTLKEDFVFNAITNLPPQRTESEVAARMKKKKKFVKKKF